MTTLLAIDTSSSSTGVAVWVEGRVAGASTLVRAYRHAENLFGRVDEALAEAGVDKTDLTGIAVTRGPGSFTGLRVGLATAKGLAFGLGVPVVGVSSLAALAEPLIGTQPVVAPMLDARKNQVYASALDGEGNLIIPEGAWDPAHFAARLAELGVACILTGSGAGAYRSIFEEVGGAFLTFAGQDRWEIDPGAVAELGHREFLAGNAVAWTMLKAVYLRRSEAEENLKRGRSAPAIGL